MLDRILGIGAAFDWISPLLASVQDIANGPAHTFLIDADCGRSGRRIAHMLRKHGVKTWGHMIVDHSIMITVRKEQAIWAQYLLEREGVPIQNRLMPERRARVPRHVHRVGQSDPLEMATSWLNRLANLLGL